MSISSILFLCGLYVLVGGDDNAERFRRGIGLLRMGKRSSMGLLRMGRSISLPPLVPPQYDFDDDIDERQSVMVGIPRMGKDLGYAGEVENRYSRHPPVPRLGQMLEEYLNEYRRELSNDDLRKLMYGTIPHRARRSADQGTETEEEKRMLPRLGVREDEEAENDLERSLPLPRLGLYDRALPRLGVRDDELTENEIEELEEAERGVPLPRLGVRDDEERAMPLPRLGLYDKRAMGMLRMGKRGLGMLRMGRGLGMLRMGRSGPEEQQQEEEKRAMGMLRMGRGMSMLRMGRSDSTAAAESEQEKRAMGMLRMGRGMSMLRMGRSEPGKQAEEEKRAMGMLRMGKRGLSMLRMGKRDMEEVDNVKDKRAMGMLRMGRSADSDADSASEVNSETAED